MGKDVTLFAVGDEVLFAGLISRNGSFAEYTVLDERLVGRKPAALSWVEAASAPLTFLTAWELFFQGMALDLAADRSQQTLLVIGGAGGVGAAALQLGKRLLKFGRVIGTASRPETIAFAKTQGADLLLNHREPLAPQLAAAGVSSVDVSVCTANFDQYFPALVEATKPFGKLGWIITDFASPKLDGAALLNHFVKSQTLVSELMFTRGLFNADPQLQHKAVSEIAELLAAKVLRPTLQQTLDGLTLDNIKAALAGHEQGTSIGKTAIVF